MRTALRCCALGVLVAALAPAGSSASPTQDAAAGAVIELPAEDRREIEKYLGTGVVGRAVAARPITDPVAFMGLDTGKTLEVKFVHGPEKGTTRAVPITVVDRPDGRRGWKLQTREDFWTATVDDAGNLVQDSTTEVEHGVLSRYEPPQPLVYKDMRPGASKRMRIDVKVFDLKRPDRQKHKGYLDLTYSYVGAYEVTVPAGTYEAALFKWQYDGKVGPASVKDNQYWFFAEGVGAIARIDSKHVSAMLVYSDKSKTAAVLAGRK